MNGSRLSAIRRGIALALCVGALPFIINARIHAGENRSQWLDDYHQKVGLTYGAKATVQTSYLWRGLYIGALNLQASANVGYGGLYFDVWCNVGSADWTFKTFQPEVDLTLGFSRWGINLYAVFIHNFNCGFFDFANYTDRGNGFELGLRYTVSSKLPLSIFWATRVSAADGFYNSAGVLVRAYSTYAEISYTHSIGDGFSLYYAVGFCPWRSLYTGYRPGFAIHNIEALLRKEWDISPHCGLMVQGQIAVNPVAATQVINLNVGCGIFLK